MFEIVRAAWNTFVKRDNVLSFYNDGIISCLSCVTASAIVWRISTSQKVILFRHSLGKKFEVEETNKSNIAIL